VIEGRDGGDAGAALPFDPKAAFGPARAPVRVTVGGTHTFRTTVAVYGGAGWVGLRKSQLAELGLQARDHVDLLVELGEQPREVELPTELAEALASDRRLPQPLTRSRPATGRSTPSGSTKPSAALPGTTGRRNPCSG
jgi:hypothetical protein